MSFKHHPSVIRISCKIGGALYQCLYIYSSINIGEWQEPAIGTKLSILWVAQWHMVSSFMSGVPEDMGSNPVLALTLSFGESPDVR